MIKNIVTVLSLVTMVAVLSLGTVTAIPALASDVGDSIEDELEPIGDVYDNSGDVDTGTFVEAIAEVIRIALSLLGIIFLILVLYAGFLWMTSAGNDEKISKAKKIMVAAIIGAAIVLAAYIITVFVIQSLIEATGASN